MQWKKVVASAVALVITAGYLPQSGYMEDNVQRDVGIAPIVSDGEQDIRGQLEKLGVAVTETDEAQEQAPAGAVAAPETAAAVLPAFTFTVPSTVPNTVPAAVEDVQPVPQAATPVLPTGTYQAPSRVLQYQPGRYSAYGVNLMASGPIQITNGYGNSKTSIIELNEAGDYEINGTVTQAIIITTTGVTLTINGTLDTSANTDRRVTKSYPLNVTVSDVKVIINATAKVKGPEGKDSCLSGSKEAYDIKVGSCFDQDPTAYLGDGLEAVKQSDGWWKVQKADQPEEKAFKDAKQAALQEIDEKLDKYTNKPYDQSNADVMALTDKYFEAYETIEEMTYSAGVTTEKTVNEKLEALREEVKDLKNKPGILIPELIAEINATLLPANDSDAQQIKKLALEKLSGMKSADTAEINKVATDFKEHLKNIEALNKAKEEMLAALNGLLAGNEQYKNTDPKNNTEEELKKATTAVEGIKYLKNGATDWDSIAENTQDADFVKTTARDGAAEVAWTVIEKLKGDDKGNHDFGINSVGDLKKLENVAKVKAKLDETCAKAPLFEAQKNANTKIDEWLKGLKDTSENAYEKYPTLEATIKRWRDIIAGAGKADDIALYLSMAGPDIQQQIDAANTLYEAKGKAKTAIETYINGKTEDTNLRGRLSTAVDEYTRKDGLIEKATSTDGVDAQLANAKRAIDDAFAAYNLEKAKTDAKTVLEDLVKKEEYFPYKTELEKILETYINNQQNGKIDMADSVGSVNVFFEEAKSAIEEKVIELQLQDEIDYVVGLLNDYVDAECGEDKTLKNGVDSIVKIYTASIKTASSKEEADGYLAEAKIAIHAKVEELNLTADRTAKKTEVSTYANGIYANLDGISSEANSLVAQWGASIQGADRETINSYVAQAKAALFSQFKKDAIANLNDYASGTTYATEANPDGTSDPATASDTISRLGLEKEINEATDNVEEADKVIEALNAAKAQLDSWKLVTLTITYRGLATDKPAVTQTYRIGATAVFTAEAQIGESCYFSYWEMGGTKLHSANKTTVEMKGDRTMVAVYEASVDEPKTDEVTISVTIEGTNVTFLTTRSMHSKGNKEKPVVQYGVLYSSQVTSGESLTFGESVNENKTQLSFNNSTNEKITNRWKEGNKRDGAYSLSVNMEKASSQSTVYARGYVIFEDGNVVYSKPLKLTKSGNDWSKAVD